MCDDFVGKRCNTLVVGIENDFRRFGHLVRVVDAGELLDLTGSSLLVKALRVACLASLERGLAKDFDEVLRT